MRFAIGERVTLNGEPGKVIGTVPSGLGFHFYTIKLERTDEICNVPATSIRKISRPSFDDNPAAYLLVHLFITRRYNQNRSA